MDRRKILQELLKCADDFKVTTVYWDHDILRPGENQLRNRPAPWIKKTIEFLNIIEGSTIVEIGSTRMQVSPNCITYYENCLTMTTEELQQRVSRIAV